MANVDPFVIQVPDRFLADPETRPYFEYLNRFLHDLWVRTGGGDDAITEVQIGELYETGIESAATVELELELNEDPFQTLVEDDNDEDPFTPQTERVWHKKRINQNTYADSYDMYSVRGGKTVYLPEYPDIDSEVIVINEDGKNITVDGNNRKIKLRGVQDSKVNWSSAGQSIHFHWFEEGPWWVGV